MGAPILGCVFINTIGDQHYSLSTDLTPTFLSSYVPLCLGVSVGAGLVDLE